MYEATARDDEALHMQEHGVILAVFRRDDPTNNGHPDLVNVLCYEIGFE
jgi:hypothetical protein